MRERESDRAVATNRHIYFILLLPPFFPKVTGGSFAAALEIQEVQETFIQPIKCIHVSIFLHVYDFWYIKLD